MRREILQWSEIDKLIDELLPQFQNSFDAVLMITRGGIIPGGMLAKALNITYVLTAAIRFPSDYPSEFPSVTRRIEERYAFPEFIQFPEDALLHGRRVLIIDDIWKRGRNSIAVASRVEAAGGIPETCVLHYKPASSLYPKTAPTYYAAITDSFIIYPWESQRGPEAFGLWE